MDDSNPDAGAVLPGLRKKKNMLLAWIWILLRIIGLVYAVLLLFLYFAQGYLIFQGAATQGKPYAMIPHGIEGERLQLRTASGVNVAALYGAALNPDGSPHTYPEIQPVFLFFYGNAMCLTDTLEQFNDFRRLGMNVLIPDYCGVGLSAGAASERGCYETADAAYEYLQKRPDIDKSMIIVGGWSLGGAVAIDLASRVPVAGLVTLSSFTSMAEMAHNTYPFIPTFLIWTILKHPFKSEQKISQVKCPILIGHSHGDRLIPYSMSDRLCAAARTPVTRLTLKDADHGDFFIAGGRRVLDAIADFVGKIASARKNH